jgi:hypothetical protein
MQLDTKGSQAGHVSDNDSREKNRKKVELFINK